MPGPDGGPEAARPEDAVWVLRRERISLAAPLLIGILNVTPDSFSDGGLHRDPRTALRRAHEMVAEGATMIDVGGESTRPGARSIDVAEEAARVVPVVRLLKAELAVPVSVDTRKAGVAREALEAGADVINDVSALGDPEMAGVVAEFGAGLVLMHMRGTPETMQVDPRYEDVAGEVGDELRRSLESARAAGIDEDRVVVDPGIGFAKNQGHNLRMLAELGRLHALGRPILLGVSRKAFIGALLGGLDPARRGVGTAAACVAALLQGVRIFRVHDVGLVREALTVAEAIRAAAPRG